MESVNLLSIDKYVLNLHIYEAKSPKGYIQLIHGMEEHQDRYTTFANDLNKIGYTVITSNMRGHGGDAPTLGFFSEKDGYKYLLEDQKLITKYIFDRYNIDKVTVFAHSMGTIITRNLLQTESNNYDRVILSGFPCPQPLSGFGIFLTNIIKFFRGNHYHSKFVERMSIGQFNKKIKKPRTKCDWLSENNENVDNYIKDQYCGFGFSVSAYNDLFKLTKNMNNKHLYKDINSDLDILLLSGEDDPCTGGQKGRDTSVKFLKNVGFNKINEFVYPNMRHEILNEREYKKVENDIIEFLQNKKTN